MKRIIYTFPIHSSFIESDRLLLSRHFKVKTYWFNTLQKKRTPFFLIHQFFFLLWNIRSAHALVSQFSGYHTFWPSVLGRWCNRPHYIILNGTEVNNFPELAYGYFSKPWLHLFSKISLYRATQLLPVGEAMMEADYTYAPVRYTRQGLHAFYPDLRTPIRVVHNGVDVSKFSLPLGVQRIRNSFITVASGLESANRRAIKGLDLVIELAWLKPEYSFTFIGGTCPPDLQLPPNIKVLGFVANDTLAGHYQAHEFYLQLSMSEGFGIAVCEAMLCGCIPIVSCVGILPQIAGPKGYVLMKKDVTLLRSLVREAAESYREENTFHVREHILSHYTLEMREKNLMACLADDRQNV